MREPVADMASYRKAHYSLRHRVIAKLSQRIKRAGDEGGGVAFDAVGVGKKLLSL